MQISKVKSSMDFNNYVKCKMPVIFEGYALSWEAHKKWDIDFFKKNIGDIQVGRMKSSSNIHPDFTCTSKWETYESSLTEYLQDLLLADVNKEMSQYFLAGDTLQILSNYKYNERLKNLCNDFNIPEFCSVDELKNIGLWISGKGPISWLHYDKDHSDNFNVQVNGSKYACLYDPKDAPNLYLKSIFESNHYNFSNYDIRSADFNSTPKVDDAIKYEGTLNPGDMLYIPSDWLHSFRHLGALNINLTFWWMSKHKIYNLFKSRDDYAHSLIKYFQAECPDLLAYKDKEDLLNPSILNKLISHLESNHDLAMFKQLESNMMNV